MIPKKIKVGSISIPVNRKKEIRDSDDNRCFGMFKKTTREIVIEIEEELSGDKLFETFIHETLEAVIGVFGLYDKIDHDTLTIMAVGLAQALEEFKNNKESSG
jgi:hypothetical protein